MRSRAQISKNSRLGSIATLNSHSNPTFCIARGARRQLPERKLSRPPRVLTTPTPVSCLHHTK